MKVQGGCHCGALTYEAEIDPAKVSLCHCTDCQVLTGTAFSAFVPVPRDAFRLKGTPRTYVKTAESGSRRVQAFCGECGTRIYAAAEFDPPAFNVRLGTMAQRAQLAPQAQFWCRSAMPWLKTLDTAPGFEKQTPAAVGR